ncbi:uncharacterized protein ACOB8E_016949 isoform 1-T2 [Sarcophilus harrisii]
MDPETEGRAVKIGSHPQTPRERFPGPTRKLSRGHISAGGEVPRYVAVHVTPRGTLRRARFSGARKPACEGLWSVSAQNLSEESRVCFSECLSVGFLEPLIPIPDSSCLIGSLTLKILSWPGVRRI